MSKKEYITKYENLFIQVIDEHWGVWVKRGGRSGESICYYKPTDAELEVMNAEAGKALQEKWFYCSRCKKAYPRTEYGYFYFAGSYCLKCKEERPDHYKMAMSERYN